MRSDTRGVSELLGAIFVFALVILLLAIIQVWAVPAANAQTEFDHNQRAIADIQSLGSDVDRAAGLGAGGSTTIDLGPQYSTRLFLLNPPSPLGSLQTADGDITISNVRAVNTETADYIDGTVELETRSLTYRPNYNQYQNAPTTRYEGWTLYNDFEDTNIVRSQRSPISGTRISLIALDGQQSTTAGGALSVPTEPISAPAQTISVSGQNGENIEITLTTGLTQDDWNDILSGEMAPQGNVQNVLVDDGEVTIELDGSQTYDLRLAKVGIGSGTTDEGAHYLTTTEPRPVLDRTGGTVTVQVRDRFNNPVPGVEVEFESTGVTFDSPVVTSDEDGIASARFGNPSVDRTTITATVDEADINPGPRVDDRRTVNFDSVPVRPPDQPDTSDSEINPDSDAALKFVSSERGPGSNLNQIQYVDVTFENRGSDKEVTDIRLNAYISNTFSGSSAGIPDEVLVDSSVLLEIGGAYETPTGGFTASVPAGTEVTYRFEFRENGQLYPPDQADFFVYTMIYDDGTTSRYFIQMEVE